MAGKVDRMGPEQTNLPALGRCLQKKERKRR